MMQLPRHGRLVLTCGIAIVAIGGGPAASARERLPVHVATRPLYEGRAIVVIHAGDPKGTRVLVVGCIHGTECAGIAVARALERTHAHVDLWMIPNLNPDATSASQPWPPPASRCS